MARDNTSPDPIQPLPQEQSQSRPTTRDPVTQAIVEDSNSEDAVEDPSTATSKKFKKPRHSILHQRIETSKNRYTIEDYERDQKDGTLYQDIIDMLGVHIELRNRFENLETLATEQQEQLTEQQEKIQDIQENNTLLANQLVDVKGELAETREYAQEVELRQRIAGHSGGRTTERTIKLPDPPRFSGGDEDDLDFEGWLTQVRGKLGGNADSFPTEALKISYVVGRLTGDAARHIAPRMRPSSSEAYTTIDELVEHLEELYIDPDREDKARAQYDRLYMNNTTPFHDFYTKFLHLANEANITKKDLLRDLNKKLSFDLQPQVLARFLEKPTLTEFAHYCTKADTHVKTMAERIRNVKARSTTPEVRRSPALSVPIATTPRAPKPGERATTTAARPRLSRPTYSDPAKQALSALGACFKCKHTGHIARNCPNPSITSIEEANNDSGNERP